MTRRILCALGVLAWASCASGCATRMPHVTACYWAPLGHPTMTPEELVSSGIDQRVHSVSEGATGRLGRN